MTSKLMPRIEGLTVAELVALDGLSALVLVGAPIVFKVGEANVLGQFSLDNTTLIAELGVVEGGGEGTLPTLIDAVEQCARRQALTAIDWRVYAVDCPTPNPKLTPRAGGIWLSSQTDRNRGDCLPPSSFVE